MDGGELGNVDESDGPAGYSFGTAERTEALGTFAFYGYWCADGSGQPLLDFGLTGGDFGAFGNDGHVDIDNRTAKVVQLTECFGKQHHAVGTRERRVGIGKQLTDITEPCRTQDRIDAGMCDHIGIRMAMQ